MQRSEWTSSLRTGCWNGTEKSEARRKRREAIWKRMPAENDNRPRSGRGTQINIGNEDW